MDKTGTVLSNTVPDSEISEKFFLIFSNLLILI